MAAELSYCAKQARQLDRDRFLCCLFAPAERREALFALLAFNQEIAKTRDVVSESLLGEVRLQWWDDAIEAIYTDGPDLARLRANPVVDALTVAIQQWRPSRGSFEQLIDGRRHDLREDTFADSNELIAYSEATSASLGFLMAEIVGEPERLDTVEATVRNVGIAWALLGQIRAIPYRIETGRFGLPLTALRDAGIEPEMPVAEIRGKRLADAIQPTAALARSHLEAARRHKGTVPKAYLPVLLPGRLADDYLERLRNAGYDVFNPKVEQGRLRRQIALYVSAVRGVY